MQTSSDDMPASAQVHQLKVTPAAERQGAVDRQKQLLRLNQVEARTALKKSAIYAGMKADPPTFPQCVRISSRCVAWRAADVDDWIDARQPAARKVPA